jgi:hypothetical protein
MAAAAVDHHGEAPPPPAAVVAVAPLDGEEEEAKVEDKKKKKRKGFFSFGGDKKDEAQLEQEAEEVRQKAAREKEQKQEEEDELRIEMQQENSRLEEKRERQQQLLKQVIDPSTRVFQLNMKAMKITNHSGSQMNGLFIKVTLGGDYEEKEEPGKGLVKKGTKGQVFTTSASAKVEHDGTYYIKGEFGAGIPIYWIGSYGGLEVQDFVLQIWCGKLLQRPRKLCEYRCPLAAIAQGSIQQELELQQVRAPLLPGQLESSRVEPLQFVSVSYVIYFQELFVFQLKFANWKGYSLRAADVAKRKERVVTSMSQEDKNKQKREEKEERQEEKKQKDRTRREKAREQRQQAATLKRGTQPADAKRGGGAEGGEAKLKLLDSDGAKAEEREEKGLVDKPKAAPKKRSQMTAAEKVEADEQKEAEKKEALQAKRAKRLEAAAQRTKKKREKARWRAEEERRQKESDSALYEAASSDPYVVFSIDPPANPGCKLFRTGGYFGRTARTDIQLNTLNPIWEEARRPLSYLGTRSELENEVLRVRVYDWDRLSADDLIGQADVPLNGLLQYGQVEIDLAYKEEDVTAPKVRGLNLLWPTLSLTFALTLSLTCTQGARRASEEGGAGGAPSGANHLRGHSAHTQVQAAR